MARAESVNAGAEEPTVGRDTPDRTAGQGQSFVLPSLQPSPSDSTGIAGAPSVYVNRFEFSGNTVFSAEELSEITGSFEGREITNEELQEVRQRLTAFYIERGYINSGVVVPDQEVVDGVVSLAVVEGTIDRIELSGNQRLREAYLRKRIWPDEDEPLNMEILQERIQLLHASRLLRRINAELRPGSRPGKADLFAEVQEAKPYAFDLQFDNHRPPSIGAERLLASYSHFNLFGWGDAIGFRYALTDGLDEYGGFYSLPLTAKDTTLEVFAEKDNAVVVEEPFDEIDIVSDAYTYGFRISHPFIRSLDRELILSVGMERRHSETFVLDEPFSFSLGVIDGKSDVTVLRFGQEWVQRSSIQVLAARSIISWGIDALDATDNDHLPDGQFLSWLGQFQWAYRLEKIWDSQILFSADFQLASESLLPLEMFSIGGFSTVRGYRENFMVRDNGVVSSVELRIPTFRLPLPIISKDASDGRVFLAPFFDAGWSWYTDLPTPDVDSIASLGIGLRWAPSPNMYGEVYWGYPLRGVETSGGDLQDDGLHFQFSWRLP